MRFASVFPLCVQRTAKQKTRNCLVQHHLIISPQHLSLPLLLSVLDTVRGYCCPWMRPLYSVRVHSVHQSTRTACHNMASGTRRFLRVVLTAHETNTSATTTQRKVSEVSRMLSPPALPHFMLQLGL